MITPQTLFLRGQHHRHVASWMLLGSGAAVDPSGQSVPESPVQAQRTLTAAVAGQTSPRNREDLQRISDANIRHGRQTKNTLAAQRRAAEVGRRVRGELKRIERQIVDAGLMPDD